jgi:hypothetical protein
MNDYAQGTQVVPRDEMRLCRTYLSIIFIFDNHHMVMLSDLRLVSSNFEQRVVGRGDQKSVFRRPHVCQE